MEFHLKALKIYESVFGENHLTTAGSYDNIGTIYLNKSDFNIALEYYRSALKALEPILDDNHLAIALTYKDIGEVCIYKGDYPQALDCYQKALEIREKMLGFENPQTLDMYILVALSLHLLGRNDEALPYAEKAIKANSHVYEYFDISATIYQGLERYEEALEQLEQCLKLKQEQNAPEESIEETEEEILVLEIMLNSVIEE